MALLGYKNRNCDLLLTTFEFGKYRLTARCVYDWIRQTMGAHWDHDQEK